MPYIPSVHDVTIIYPVGIATIDTHQTLEKEEETSLSYLKWSYKSCSVSQLSNIDCTLVSWLRGVVKSTQQWTIIGVTSIIKFRIWKTMLELLPSLWFIHLLPCQSGWAVSWPLYVCCWLVIGRSMIRLHLKNIRLLEPLGTSAATLPAIRSIDWFLQSPVDSLWDWLVLWSLAILLLEACLQLVQ